MDLPTVERAPYGELRIHAGVDHFDIYDGPADEELIADQLDFLRRHLAVGAAPPEPSQPVP